MNIASTTRLGALAVATALSLSGCGGGGKAGVGGTLSGLSDAQSVTAQDNGGDTLTLTANGGFRFGTELDSGANYNVTILTQPVNGFCQVANATGQIDTNGDLVSNVAIACIATNSVGGTVSGLTPGTAVTLSNGTVLVPVATNGAFAFPGTLPAGTSYEVTVATQPAGLSCVVLGGVGSVATGSATAITVTCA